MLKFKAFAKINLTLDILGRRPDGYHEIASIFQSITLADELDFEPSKSVGLSAPGFPVTVEQNLVYRAALALREESGLDKGARITLHKNIPMAAGLGGGSSDAAVTLIALNRLWDLNFSRGRLAEIGSKVGSDVPFFFYGGTALVEGRGERVTVLPSLGTFWVVLLKPPLAISTAELYGRLATLDFSNGAATKKLVEGLREKPGKADLGLYNAFWRVVVKKYPQMADHERTMVQLGGKVGLSGSGPTLYSIFRDQGSAITAFESLKEGHEVYLARTVNHGWEEVV